MSDAKHECGTEGAEGMAVTRTTYKSFGGAVRAPDQWGSCSQRVLSW